VRATLDTNILVYAEGVNGAQRKSEALALVRKLALGVGVISVQTLGELFHVLVRKANWKPPAARNAVLGWSDVFPLVETSQAVLVGAMELAITHRLNFWDSVILAAAAEGGCRLLLTEDLQEGFSWRGVTVANPFRSYLINTFKPLSG